MALTARFVPLVAGRWPGKQTASYARRRAAFRVGYAQRLEALDAELAKLGAKDIIIEAEFEAREIRNDGWPRSTARPKGPAIIVSFKSDKGPLSFPCDTYTGWEDNLYAIALALEALRAVDRYGVTRQAEQYRGWAQLPPPAAERKAFADRAAAAEWLWVVSGTNYRPDLLLAGGDPLAAAYRMAAKKLHPDSGGTTAEFQKLQDAMRLIDQGGRRG